MNIRESLENYAPIMQKAMNTVGFATLAGVILAGPHTVQNIQLYERGKIKVEQECGVSGPYTEHIFTLDFFNQNDLEVKRKDSFHQPIKKPNPVKYIYQNGERVSFPDLEWLLKKYEPSC
jgi:hypothetical protein